MWLSTAPLITVAASSFSMSNTGQWHIVSSTERAMLTGVREANEGEEKAGRAFSNSSRVPFGELEAGAGGGGGGRDEAASMWD